MTSASCLAVMYHYVRDTAATPFPDIRALPPSLFEQQLDWLQAQYEVVTLPRLEAALAGRTPLPRNAAVLTFDDGLIDHYETVFPLLRARGLSGTFFLTEEACGETPRLLPVHKVQFLLAHLGASAFGEAVLAQCGRRPPHGGGGVFGLDQWDDEDARAIKHLLTHELPFDEAERILAGLFAQHIGDVGTFARRLYLQPAMVREMAAGGMTFGYHTRSHRLLARLSAGEQEGELRGGVPWIRALTGQTSVPFCYPWGGPHTYTADTVRLLQAAGYSLAFNTVRRHLRIDDPWFELPRIDTRDLPPYPEAQTGAGTMLSTGEA
jgi:peptidoglycan/xylan/chitin deacetylase (PgdA/CDA1 family)